MKEPYCGFEFEMLDGTLCIKTPVDIVFVNEKAKESYSNMMTCSDEETLELLYLQLQHYFGLRR